ncbi:MAG: UDP-N-acetylglucosamine--N-acetylmuramyl-(pentapeptide) pyrophosphoryl-undecaprenol N-acetylglucosamine transferase [Chloroflexia bacterium]|nr:UDP-N-acetylglucosamine--N-acetylmuramyl-(pentapeptide) pyrophosphoryl-undecaprenol N-acetylglucosamine transferase [Chloroflexia bacterium]
MRVLIAGGGTGGHVYPALAVAAALPAESPVLYVGTEGGMEAGLIEHSGLELPFAAIPAAALRGRAPWTILRNLVVLVRGVREAGRRMAQFKPEVVLVTGGYSSVPVGVAARIRGIPLLLYLPDVVPGLAVRFLAHLASRVATSTPDAAAYLPRGDMVVSGYPVRPALWQTDRRQARAFFGLTEEEKVLLVYGGSRGARSINRALAADLEAFVDSAAVVHICGREGDEVWLRERAAKLPDALRARYLLYPYLHRMHLAFAAADLAVCRAGASVLGELPAAGLPAVLIPYPYVHQEENADYLLRQGAAVKIQDSCLQGEDGGPRPQDLRRSVEMILDDTALRLRMAAAMRQLARRDAVEVLLQHLQALADMG